MKKVLALVLAVIMVCTMAMAVTITTTGKPAYNGSTDVNATPIVPGDVLYMTLEELAGKPGWYADKDGNFVPANNVVTVTFGKGADLVKSQGWVQVGEDKTAAASWQYQIALKDSDTATADGKTVDLSITKVTFKAYGEPLQTYVYDGKEGNLAKVEFDYGWPTADLVLPFQTAKAQEIGGFELLPLNTIVTLLATTDAETGDVLKENTWTISGEDEWDGNQWRDTASIAFHVTAGQKILRKDFNGDFVTEKWINTYIPTTMTSADVIAGAVNDTNLTGTATVTNWSNKYNAYAISIDGKVSALTVSVDDGVATIKVPAYSAVAVIKGTLKSVSAAETETGTTTNPGTGANDVVGVAAALAVVALVSGAAISLKK